MDPWRCASGRRRGRGHHLRRLASTSWPDSRAGNRAASGSVGSRRITYANPLGRADVTFPATGDAYPKRLVHQDRRLRTTVDYVAFNAPVTIDPPASAETSDLTDSVIWRKATRFVL